MELEATDWVYVPEHLRQSETGLGVILDAEAEYVDRAIAAARVRFVGFGTQGSVWAVSSLRRVQPEEELGIVLALRLLGALEPDMLDALLGTWNAACKRGGRQPHLLTQAWSDHGDRLATPFAAWPPGTWPRSLVGSLLGTQPPTPRPRPGPALAIRPAPPPPPPPKEAWKPPPRQIPPVPKLPAEAANWPLLTLDLSDGAEPYLILRSDSGFVRLCVRGKHLALRHLLGSVYVAATVDLAWSGRTLRLGQKARVRLAYALKQAARDLLQTRSVVRLVHADAQTQLRGLRLERSRDVPGPPPLHPVERNRPRQQRSAWTDPPRPTTATITYVPQAVPTPLRQALGLSSAEVNERAAALREWLKARDVARWGSV